MQDSFKEECANLAETKKASRRYNAFKGVAIAFIVLAVLWAFVLMFLLNVNSLSNGTLWLNILFILMPLIMFISCAVFFGLQKNKFYVLYLGVLPYVHA